MEYEIEKGIAIEDTKSKFNKFPFLKMEIGDSFLVDKIDSVDARIVAQRVKQRKGLKFKTKKVTADGKVRIWRVE